MEDNYEAPYQDHRGGCGRVDMGRSLNTERARAGHSLGRAFLGCYPCITQHHSTRDY